MMNAASKKEQIINILNDNSNTKSGVTFEYSHHESKPFITIYSLGFDPSNNNKQNGIGGYGIDDKSILELERYLPGIVNRMMQEEGKIVFPGNGLSDVVLDLIKENKNLKEKPVINDIFDYQSLYEDLTKLKRDFNRTKIEFLLSSELEKLQRMLHQIEKGNIVSVNYFFGNGNVPEVMKGASLVINCCGPPFFKTLDETLSLLNKDGELYVFYPKKAPFPPGLKVTPISVKSGLHEDINGYIIRRK